MLIVPGLVASVMAAVLLLVPTTRPDVVALPGTAAPSVAEPMRPHRLGELLRAQRRVMRVAARLGVQPSYAMRSHDRTRVLVFVGRAELARIDRVAFAEILSQAVGLAVVVRHGEPIVFQ